MLETRRWSCPAVTFLIFSIFLGSAFGTRAQGVDDIEKRRAFILGTLQAATGFNRTPKYGTYSVIAKSASGHCPGAEYSDYMADVILGGADDGKTLKYDLFSLPPLVRYLYQFGHCFDRTQSERMSALLARPINFTGHGTINHAVLLATSWYLLAQYLPSQKWTDVSGKVFTSAQLMAIEKDLLERRTEGFFKEGFLEQASPTYGMVNFFPLLNLFDFATDPDIRKIADDEAQLIVALMKVNAFQGRLVPPLTRAVHRQQVGPWRGDNNFWPSVSQHILWFYFGAPAFERDDFLKSKEPNFITMLALSKWRPRDEILALSSDQDHPYEVKSRIPAFSYWGGPSTTEIYGSSYFAKNYAIGTANHVFDVAGYNDANQSFGIFFSTQDQTGRVECYHPYWLSNHGSDLWSTDLSSPFQETFRDRNRGVLLFDIPKSDPYVFGPENRFFSGRSKNAGSLFQIIKCRYPASVDDVRFDGAGIYLREGGVFVALLSLRGDWKPGPVILDNSAAFATADLDQSKAGIYFEVSEGAPGDFAAFIETVKSRRVSFKDGAAVFDSIDGKRMSVTFRHEMLSGNRVSALPEVEVDGAQVRDVVAEPFSSPQLKLADGVLSVIRHGASAST